MSQTFQDRLSIILKSLKLQDQELAQAGGVTKATFNSYKNGESHPRLTVLVAWCTKLKIDANWLLTGEGNMLLAEKPAPLTSPLAQRVNRVASTMSDSGADDLSILRATRAMIDGEINKVLKERGGYGVAEPQAGLDRAAEEPAEYADPKKAAGGSSG